jgi:hypothetical protein
VHTAAMLVVSGAVAVLVCNVKRCSPQRWLRSSCSSQSANSRASGSASGAMP